MADPDTRAAIERIRSESPEAPAPLPSPEAMQEEILRQLRQLGTDTTMQGYVRVAALGKLAELLRSQKDDDVFERRLQELEAIAESKGLL